MWNLKIHKYKNIQTNETRETRRYREQSSGCQREGQMGRGSAFCNDHTAMYIEVEL